MSASRARPTGLVALPSWVGGGRAGTVALALACCLAGPASAGEPPADAPTAVQELRSWVLGAGDNHGQPFVIVDKIGAQAVAFDRSGTLIGSAPVLLGVAFGDESPPGIGDKPLADIGPEDRITPAGRFAAQLGENLSGKTVLWVDYDAAVSLHAVVTGKPSDHRQARLDSPTSLDNRISYGCINVPAPFYKEIVEPLFKDTPGLVYVLPETRSLRDQFFPEPVQQ